MEDRQRALGNARLGDDDSTRAAAFGAVLVRLLAYAMLTMAFRSSRQASRMIGDVVARGGALCALLLVVACASTPAGDPAPEGAPVRAYPQSGAAVQPESALRTELLAMGREDQAVRTGLSPEMIQDTAFVRRLMRTDTALSVRLREIVERSGWPDAGRVGRDAVHAAFLIVQHTPFDEFREAMLPHVERDVREGVLDGQDYASMVDRIRAHRGEAQLYGTQYSLVDGVLRRDPVEDPANLDRRREELGLMPIAEYERLLADFYDAPVSAD